MPVESPEKVTDMSINRRGFFGRLAAIAGMVAAFPALVKAKIVPNASPAVAAKSAYEIDRENDARLHREAHKLLESKLRYPCRYVPWSPGFQYKGGVPKMPSRFRDPLVASAYTEWSDLSINLSSLMDGLAKQINEGGYAVSFDTPDAGGVNYSETVTGEKISLRLIVAYDIQRGKLMARFSLLMAKIQAYNSVIEIKNNDRIMASRAYGSGGEIACQ